MSKEDKDIAVIGGGPIGVSGASALSELVSNGDARLDRATLHLFDPEQLNYGAGEAFLPYNSRLLANTPVKEITSNPFHPDDFQKWIERNGDSDCGPNYFPTRAAIGQYFNERSQDLHLPGWENRISPGVGDITCYLEEIVDLEVNGCEWTVHNSKGRSTGFYSSDGLSVTDAILTLGHPYIANPVPNETENYWESPYFHSIQDRAALTTQLVEANQKNDGSPVKITFAGQGAGALDGIVNVESEIQGTDIRVEYDIISSDAEFDLWWPRQPHLDGRKYEYQYLTAANAKLGPTCGDWKKLLAQELEHASANGFGFESVYCNPELIKTLSKNIPVDARDHFENFTDLFDRRYGGVCNPDYYELVSNLHADGRLNFIKGRALLEHTVNRDCKVVVDIQGQEPITTNILIRSAPYSQSWLDETGTPRNKLLQSLYAKGHCSFDRRGRLRVTDEQQLIGTDDRPVQGLYAAGPAVGSSSKWGLQTFQRQLLRIPFLSPLSPANQNNFTNQRGPNNDAFAYRQ